MSHKFKFSLEMSVLCIVHCLLLLISYTTSKSVNYYDICKNNSGHRLYLDLDEFGILEATNLTHKNGSKIECYLEIVTCPSCIISLNISYLNLSNECNQTKNTICGCEYIQTFEHPYEDLSTKRFCGRDDNINMNSVTRNLVIQLYYLYNNNLGFTVEYKSIRNHIILSDSKNNYLLSSFFPSYYPNDLTSEYTISCPEAIENCVVRLIFTDFQIDTGSIMEIFDYNGQRLEVVTGMHFRPPILISSGPNLVVRFYANGGTGLGFKAEYIFGDSNDNDTEYNTDCGGYVNNLGGGITMMNMAQQGIKKFNCFWIIKPPKNFLHFKTYLYLKIANFSNMEDHAEIIVYKTTTSNGKILEILRYPNHEIYSLNPREHIQPIETGFYVSLKGSFGVKSRLAIVYSAFSYKECFSGADFLCENHRCIPRLLTCDGFDHCGDGSDEPLTCYKDAKPEPTDRRWYSRTPNYFFPKIDQYSDLKTATLIFIISSLGLISLVSTLFVLLYRINNRARHERELQNHLQIITDLLEEEIIETESIQDDPPIYEAPPDYDEVIKINCELRKLRRKKRRSRSQKYLRSIKTDTNVEYFHRSIENETVPNYFDDKMKNIANKCDEGKPKKNFRKNNPFLYFSDKAISSNVKLILKRKWHSLGELNIKKDMETKKKKNKNSQSPISINKIELFSRETASDSELLNLDSDHENNLYHYVNETTTDEKKWFDYFKKKSCCQCEGACGCANINKKNIRKFNKKVLRKKHSKFYTR